MTVRITLRREGSLLPVMLDRQISDSDADYIRSLFVGGGIKPSEKCAFCGDPNSAHGPMDPVLSCLDNCSVCAERAAAGQA